MHIYAFGSVCRGDVSPGSDVDLLAIVEGHDPRFSAQDYSIHSYERIREIWAEGNPFAWHLSIEAKLLYSEDQLDFLVSLGRPTPYGRCRQDCEKFLALFREARDALTLHSESKVFDLSMVFLAIRNTASCFSLGMLPKPDFSRHSALRIGVHSLSIPNNAYRVLERSRILSTRGIGEPITDKEAQVVFVEFSSVESWMVKLGKEIDQSCGMSSATV
jgi:predicted nucleotidyltransferase